MAGDVLPEVHRVDLARGMVECEGGALQGVERFFAEDLGGRAPLPDLLAIISMVGEDSGPGEVGRDLQPALRGLLGIPERAVIATKEAAHQRSSSR